MKPLSAGWIVSLYDYIKSKVKNGFKEAGIVCQLDKRVAACIWLCYLPSTFN